MALDQETLSTNDRVRLSQYMDGAMKEFQEIEDRKGALKDMTKALAEEFGWPAKDLMKAARVRFKATLEAEKESFNRVEEILIMTGA